MAADAVLVAGIVVREAWQRAPVEGHTQLGLAFSRSMSQKAAWSNHHPSIFVPVPLGVLLHDV